MNWIPQRSRSARRKDVEGAFERTRQHIEESVENLRFDIAAVQTPKPRRVVPIAISSALFIGAGLAGWLLFSASLSGVPASTDPGRIGIAVLEEELLGGERTVGPMQVVGLFGINDDGSTSLKLTVSDFETARSPDSPPTRVALYFCGPIRDGLRIAELNDGELEVHQLPRTGIVYDSFLGDRSDCDYAVARFSNGMQAMVVGNSSYRPRAESAANVTYTAPGIVSVPVSEELRGGTAYPLESGSEINVAFIHLPADLSIINSTPLIPTSGQPFWSYEVAVDNLPVSYQFTGELELVKNQNQTKFYIASGLAGISGAALLWLLEIFLSTILEKRATV